MDERSDNGVRDSSQHIANHFGGKMFSHGISVRAEAVPSRFSEQAYFSVYLGKGPDSWSTNPVFSGLFSAGRRSQHIAGWVDGDYFDLTHFPYGSSFSLTETGTDLELFGLLGQLVPIGGSLMVAYSLFSKEAKVHRDTKLGLDRGYPPVVTPLGYLLFVAGCGVAFKDWYFAEGGREGPEKLQGHKAMNAEEEKQKLATMSRELQAFLSQTIDQDDLLQDCKARARRVVQEIERRLSKST
ncbi:MAG: DUF1122 family protein [Candidatus Bathyarchaeia archaeon]